MVDIHAFGPRNTTELGEFVSDMDAVIFALGTDTTGATTLFYETTTGLINAMKQHDVDRLIAITGVGAGETRGHGGFVYDWIIFPFFTRQRYDDNDKQEELIMATGLAWTIVRPAPFSDKPVAGDLEVHTTIKPETRLTRITSDEIAAALRSPKAWREETKSRLIANANRRRNAVKTVLIIASAWT